MAIPATQMNLPLTTLNIADATNTAVLDGTHLHIESIADSTLNADLTNATLRMQNGLVQSSLTANDGLDLYDSVTEFHTQLKPFQLKSEFQTFDMSFNALTLGGIASTENQVITADVDGKPYWADLPASEVPTLSEVLTAGYTAENKQITNLQSLGFYSVGSSASLSGNIYGDIVFGSPADVSGDTKEFSRAYLPICVGGDPYGTRYYLPLYKVPV